MSKNYKLVYRPEIDGLRAIAVIAILVFHSPKILIGNFQFLQGGYLGVDIFFVISGYLITSIILKEFKLNNKFSLLNFYKRRMRRIMPALLFMVATCFIFAWLFLLPNNLLDFSKTSISSLFFSSNYYFYFSGLNYIFSTEKNVLLHTWSLSIEEQFYLIFPIILFFLFKINKIFIKYFFYILIFISFITAIVTSNYNPLLSFYSLQTRLWELGFGSLIAYYENNYIFKKKTFFYLNIASIFGFIAILFSLFFLDEKISHPSIKTLIPVLGTGLILLHKKNNFLEKLLSYKIFTSIGLISYSLYLWHYPIILFADFFERIEGDFFQKNFTFILIFLSLIFVISFLSYYFIEKPFREKKIEFKKVFYFILFFYLLILSINLISIKFKGRINKENISFQNLILKKDYDKGCKFIAAKNINFKIDKKNQNRINDCIKNLNQFVLILGDFHAQDLFNSFSKISDQNFIVGFINHACNPSKAECNFDNIIKFVKENKIYIKKIIVTTKGSFYLTNTGNLKNPNYTPARKLPILTKDIEKSIRFYKRLNNLSPIIYIGPHIEPNIQITKKLMKGLIENKIDLKNYDKNINLDLKELDLFLNKEMKKNNIAYISKIEILDFNFHRDFYVNGNFTFSDVGHWSEYGKEYFGKKLISSDQLKGIFE